MNKIEEKDNSNKDILNQKLLNSESIIIGNWLKNLRLQNKQMKIEIIEEYLSLKEGDLLLIEEGLKNLDYITITKLIGIYCEDIETDTFQYIMKNINNNLSMNDNANILNKILDKCSLYILEEDKFKIIEINENEKIKISREEDTIIVEIRKNDISLKEEIKIDFEHYNYKNLLDNIMVLYRKLYYMNIREIIINKSKVLKRNEFVDILFKEL